MDGRKKNNNNEDTLGEDGDQTDTVPYLTESGFKFSYGTQVDQGAGHVTAYIPVDFRDGELVRQLYTHLYDYYDTCCGHNGFLRFGPDGRVNATVQEDAAWEEAAARSSGSSNFRSGKSRNVKEDAHDAQKINILGI